MTAILDAPVAETGQPVLRITAHRVPDPEPPYDVHVPVPTTAALALAPWVPPPQVPVLRLVPEPEPKPDTFDPVRTPRDDLEDPEPRAAMLVRAVLEALSGDRAVGQLMRWTTPELYSRLEALAATYADRPWAATVRKVLVAEPLPGIAEVTALVRRGGRTLALALRMEGVDGRWLLTAVDLG